MQSRFPHLRSLGTTQLRLRVVPHFSSGIVERAKRERAWKSPTREKATRGGEREKWGTTDKAQAFDPSRPTDFGVWSSYPLPNQLSTSILSPRRVSPFLAWGDFHARSRFARSTIPEDKWGTTRSLEAALQPWIFIIKNAKQLKKLSKINFKKCFKNLSFRDNRDLKQGERVILRTLRTNKDYRDKKRQMGHS